MRKLKVQLFTVSACILLLASCTDENTSPTGDDRDNFTGTWTCSEQSTINGSSTFSVTISKIGDLDSVSIKNFYGLGPNYSAIALISGGSITIPNQSIQGGYTTYGDGLKSNSKINFTYYVNFSGVSDTVTAVYSK
ncbi:MAG: hypothetical protein ABI723_21480 [Bacteroidia bacterium]